MRAITEHAYSIIVDTREKLPLDFAPRRTISRKLDIGDYSVKGLERHLVVEYKSQPDWLICCGRHRDHFTSQLQRLSKIAYSCVVVGGNFYSKNRWGSMTRRDILYNLARFQTYKVPILFTQTRTDATQLILNYLDWHGNILRRSLFQALVNGHSRLDVLQPILESIEASED